MWTVNHFPAAMRSLNPSTRAKAIEVANRLLEQGQLDGQRIVAISIEEARRWARLEASHADWSTLAVRTFA
ncbi:DUF2188 domain-containing protein [Spirosoma sp.]|uniref:DUF2188 domain-containing protein n=1 Tax=Spirosoma sp. TaxID=1899569 RepID=UPI0026045D7D|nr:DUF2188 domain-containing protein [Spirosoma sp.]MCX6217737.1 DUF2188 domain-containing protein [Spirosoma sp.]